MELLLKRKGNAIVVEKIIVADIVSILNLLTFGEKIYVINVLI